MPNAIKQKICRVCKTSFTPTRPMMRVCSPMCGLTWGRMVNERKAKKEHARDRRETREKLVKMKGRGYWMARAQKAFNLFIRTRDYGQPCISSSRQMDWTGNGVDAGHYRSRGSAPHLRFDERNCHAQSKQENRYASGNVTGYRLGLIARIGLTAVEALECDQTPAKWSIDDLKAIEVRYLAKTKELKARMA